MRAVGIGIQDFEKIRSNNQFYVDKTSFIGEWYRKNDDITLITRPRRFGKTLTIDMMNCFFSTTYSGRSDLFDGLTVSRDPEIMALQGTVPTIVISFSGIKGETLDDFLIGLSGRIGQLFRRFSYLADTNFLTEEESALFTDLSRPLPDVPDPELDKKEFSKYIYKLTHSLQFLSSWLYKSCGKKPFIFMDEYDTPVQASYINQYYEKAIGILRNLFSETFKDNRWLGRALITGITRIAKESLFSEMNNLAVYSVISGGYDRIFGFTSPEMVAILDEFGLTGQKEQIRFWYDGFTIGDETEIYNPWSVINYLSRRPHPPEDYWAQSGGIGLADHLLRRSGTSLKEGFVALLSGETILRRIREDLIYPKLESDENAVWSLLIAAGYLKPAHESGITEQPESPSPEGLAKSAKTGITITNHEARLCLTDMVISWFETRSGNYMENFAGALLHDDLQGMNAQMKQVILLCASNFDSGTKPSGGNLQPENFFHALTLGMLTCLSGNYHLTSNRESGYGRYDVSLEPLKGPSGGNAYILEFKVFSKNEGDRTLEDTAMRARMQIDGKRYDTELIQRGFPSEQIRKYGMGFRGKDILIV